MRNTEALTSLDDYLNTSYEPDMDFVDGVLVMRNVGTQQHGSLQGRLVVYFDQYRQSHRLKVFPETRLLVNASTGRHRVPDIMVVGIPYKKGKVVVDVPLIAVEVKSPDDTFDDITERCLDYERLTIPNIVVMYPDNKRAWSFIDSSLQLIKSPAIDLALPDRTLALPLAQLFAEAAED